MMGPNYIFGLQLL